MTTNPPAGSAMLEPAGTVLLGSIRKRAYLYVCQTDDRMEIERANARQHGIQDPIDFLFYFDGQRFAVSYADLKAMLGAREAYDPDGIMAHPPAATISLSEQEEAVRYEADLYFAEPDFGKEEFEWMRARFRVLRAAAATLRRVRDGELVPRSRQGTQLVAEINKVLSGWYDDAPSAVPLAGILERARDRIVALETDNDRWLRQLDRAQESIAEFQAQLAAAQADAARLNWLIDTAIEEGSHHECGAQLVIDPDLRDSRLALRDSVREAIDAALASPSGEVPR
jgi:hypothetical protein